MRALCHFFIEDHFWFVGLFCTCTYIIVPVCVYPLFFFVFSQMLRLLWFGPLQSSRDEEHTCIRDACEFLSPSVKET